MADAKKLRLPLHQQIVSGMSITSLNLNDNDNAVAMICQSETTDAITHIGVRLGSITGTTPTYIVSLEGLDTSGNPNGTVKGGGSPASATFSPSSLGWSGSTFNWVALANSYTPSRGEDLAVCCRYSSGTVNGSNFASFAYDSTPGVTLGRPYSMDFQTAWTKRLAGPMMAYKTASNVYGYPIQSATTTIYNSGSASTEYGFRFALPAAWGNTFKIAGVRLLCSLPAASTVDMTLYSGGGASDTTSLQSVTSVDGDFSASGNRVHDFYFTDSSLATLNFGNTYRIALKANTATSATIYYTTHASNADLAAFPLGADVYLTHRAAGNWTDVSTSRPFAELILDDITEPTGGGSGGGPLIGGRIVI